MPESTLFNRKNMINRRYLEAVNQRAHASTALIFDGAMGTNLQKLGLQVADFGGEATNGCNDFLVISKPGAVEAVHRSFLEVGVDVIETNTFRSNRITLAEYGLADRVVEINRVAASLARRVADEFSIPRQPRFVAGSIGPSGKLPSASDPELSNVTFDDLADVFREQAVGLIQGGVDVLLVETSQDILEVRAAIAGIHQAFDETGIVLPIQVQVTLDTTGRMLLGTDIKAALAILDGQQVDVIGLNCSTGPEHMREPIRYLGAHSPLPVSCIPNAGLPLNVDGEAVYPLEPEPFAQMMAEFVEKNHISVVGGCCGTTPVHLQRLVERLRPETLPGETANASDLPVDALKLSRGDFQTAPYHPPALASAIGAVAMRQEPPPLLIGERCNAQGSKKFKRLLLAEDWDAILELARSQVDGGAHALDISVAVTERADEINLMHAVVKKLSSGVDVPLVIDTTEPDVMEAAMKTAPGRCLLNSTHLEAGRQKADHVFRLARQHNAAVLVLTIDENGMAKSVEKKMEVARRIYDIAVHEHGLRPHDLVFDTLTFTLATGDQEYSDSAVHTIEAIRRIKAELPGVFTSLGVSNVSFGLSAAARPILNSVMLYHAVQAGLDMAIVNPAQITPYAEIPENERQLAENLIFNRQSEHGTSINPLQEYINYFASVDATMQPGTQVADPTQGMTPEQRLHWRILHRHKDGVETDIDELIELKSIKAWGSTRQDVDVEIPASGIETTASASHQAAVDILNSVLLPAMKEVGDKFGAGELILPFVLQSAEVMKKAVAHLEKYLERKEGTSKGIIVLATVYGDVHDIGKNLVKTILSNNGYTVVDLGKQVPAEKIITQAVELQADAIGLSALLVSTSKQMPLVVNELHRRNLRIPVLVGGAAINRRFGWRIVQTDGGAPYPAGVFYCKDAFEGLAVMDALVDDARRPALLEQLHKDADREMNRQAGTGKVKSAGQRSRVATAMIIPQPATWGPRVVHTIPLEIVFRHIFKNELFRLSWGAKNAHGEEWQRIEAEFESRLEKMQRDAYRLGWLKPQGVYGFWPAQSLRLTPEDNGSIEDELVVYDPASVISGEPAEIARFKFPRQPAGEHLCLSDYFSPVASGRMDVVAFQVVTVGQEATQRFERFQAAGDYTEAYFTHGLAVQTAEATAEYLHRHIRRELGLAEDQGKRYSWGYPAIPDLEDHRKVFDLLPAESELQMSLTAAFQLVPEQSTAAIIVHHPDARYFSIGESRVEQLMKRE